VEINTYQGSGSEELGKLISNLTRRIERIEQQDKLTRIHPVTGSSDFAGTVFRTPDGTPVMVVSQQSGYELPGTSGQISSADPADDEISFNPLPETDQALWRVFFTGILTDAVEIDMTFTGTSTLSDTTFEFWLEPFIVDDDFGTLQLQTTSPTFTTGQSANHFYQGVWRWVHGLGLDVSAIWGITMYGRTAPLSGPGNVSNTIHRLPRFAVQRGSNVMQNYDPVNPFHVQIAAL